MCLFFLRTWGEHEKGRITASEGRGLLPAVPPGEKAPVRTGRFQARIAGREAAAARRREESRDPLGSSQGPVKQIMLVCTGTGLSEEETPLKPKDDAVIAWSTGEPSGPWTQLHPWEYRSSRELLRSPTFGFDRQPFPSGHSNT